MNLSFSTRGWQALSWEETLAMAQEMQFAGIEPYNLPLRPDWTGRGGAFEAKQVPATARILKEKGLSIPCLDTGCDLSDPACLPVLTGLMALAHELHAPCVAGAALGSDEAAVYDVVRALLAEAEKQQVTLLIKTSGLYTDTARLRTLLDSFASDYLGALWDVHHPCREAGETPADTIKNLGAYVRHVHLRDSEAGGGYALLGEGTLPLAAVMGALGSIDYDGFISAEWKPEWMRELDDPNIIFPHFVNYMHRFDSPRGKKKALYDNHDHTGKYVWKKDELIAETFPQVLHRMAQEFPDQYAFRYTTLDYTRTYAAFERDVDTFARALLSLGVRRGSKIAIWATNVPAWYITFWATTKIGAVLVSVNTAYKIHEAEYLLRQSDTHTLVMVDHCLDSDYAGIIRTLCPELENTRPGQPLHSKKLPFLRNVITVGFRMKGCLTFEQAMARSELVPAAEVARMAAAVRPDDVCNMQYTSGTTGFPKGVMLTHYNVVNNGKCIGDRMDLSTADRMMIQVPMFHCFGMVLAMTASMTHGTTLCPLPYFSAKVSLACINQERITCFHGVPTMFIAMFNHPDYRKTDFSYMRTGIMAGSGCPPELMRRAADPQEMNMTGIVSVYGQTESSPGSTMTAWDDPLDVRCGTVGYAFPHVECKVIDPETGETVPDGVNGEFCSRGYNTMKGYYKMPEETAAAVDQDGWLHSGDMACRDEQGNYRITGRLKDMIIRGGENIYPKEIEEFIYTHPAVKDVQVIGVPDKKYGEEIMACVILKEPGSLTEQQLLDYIKASLARHKVPRYIEFTDAFPMNAAGKILKYKMRQQAMEKLGLRAEGIDTASRPEKP
ncbi:MAG: AMP-binding protein [Clostridia bacterium]|nr:AMP-binding protein [Clostridia bacterium]